MDEMVRSMNSAEAQQIACSRTRGLAEHSSDGRRNHNMSSLCTQRPQNRAWQRQGWPCFRSVRHTIRSDYCPKRQVGPSAATAAFARRLVGAEKGGC